MNHIYEDIKTALRQAVEIEKQAKEKNTMPKKTLYRITRTVTINGKTRTENLPGLSYGEVPIDSATAYSSFDELWEAICNRGPKFPAYFFDTYINRRGRKLTFWADDPGSKYLERKDVTSETLWQAEVSIKYIPVESRRFSVAELAERLDSLDFIHFLQDSLCFELPSESHLAISATTASLYKTEGEPRNVRQ